MNETSEGAWWDIQQYFRRYKLKIIILISDTVELQNGQTIKYEKCKRMQKYRIKVLEYRDFIFPLCLLPGGDF